MLSSGAVPFDSQAGCQQQSMGLKGTAYSQVPEELCVHACVCLCVFTCTRYSCWSMASLEQQPYAQSQGAVVICVCVRLYVS